MAQISNSNCALSERSASTCPDSGRIVPIVKKSDGSEDAAVATMVAGEDEHVCKLSHATIKYSSLQKVAGDEGAVIVLVSAWFLTLSESVGEACGKPDQGVLVREKSFVESLGPAPKGKGKGKNGGGIKSKVSPVQPDNILDMVGPKCFIKDKFVDDADLVDPNMKRRKASGSNGKSKEVDHLLK